MYFLRPFFQLVRWPNLLFIAVTQVLFHYCIVLPSAVGNINTFQLKLTTPLFWLLALSSICIAAAGYIINDYFDINIDQINKPQKMVVDRSISRRRAMILHLILSLVGILLSIYISWKLENWVIAPSNTVCVILLWIYSTTYKRRLLIGNFFISFLTAWVILVLLVAEMPGWWAFEGYSLQEKLTIARLSRIGMLYAGFAFMLTLVREVIKDIEDMEGDRKYDCRTMPIVWGIPAAKIFVAVWLVVLIAALIISQVYVIQFGWWLSAGYVLLLVVIPLLFIFKQLYLAKSIADYAILSKNVKYVMLSGILSMLFFLLYTH